MSDFVYTRSRTRNSGFSIQTIPFAKPPFSGMVFLTYDVTATESNSGQAEPSSEGTCTVVSVSPTGTLYDQFIGTTKTTTVEFPPFTGGNLTNPARNKAIDAVIAYINGSLNSLSSEYGEHEIYFEKDAAIISDNPTVGFHRRMKEGEIINNPVINHKSKVKIEHKVITPPRLEVLPQVQRASTAWGPNKLQSRMVSVPGNIDYPPFSNDDVIAWVHQQGSYGVIESFDTKQIAIDKAFGSVNKGAYAFLEELGEAGETLSYISSIFTRIADMVKFVKRGEFRTVVPKTHKRVVAKAKRQARQKGTHWKQEYADIALTFVSSAWLELRFAIRPLIFLAEDAVKLHKEGLQAHAGRSVSNFKIESVGADKTFESYDLDGIRYDLSYHIESKRVATAGVLIDISAAVANARMLGLTNIAGAAWELTFLSWAADYFLSTDGLIYHLTPDIGVNPLAAWSGTDDEIIVETRVTRTHIATNTPLDTLTILSNRDEYERHPVDGPGFIQLDVNLDVAKLTDLAALFTVLRSGSQKGVIK